MIRRIVMMAAVVACTGALSACTFSLNYVENIRYINHLGRQFHDIRTLTNKYWFDYDDENPFDGG